MLKTVFLSQERIRAVTALKKMDRALLPDDDADSLESAGTGVPATDGEPDYASVRNAGWPGVADPFEQEPVRVSERAPDALRQSKSFARTLRTRPLARISEEIFEQIAIERSDAAFSEFYEGMAPKIYNFAFRLLQSEDDALDVFQDTFAEVWNKAPVLYNIHTNLAAWALHLARNLAIDQLRSKHHKTQSYTESYEPDRHENLIHDDHTPERNLTMIEAREEIKNAIEKLNPEQRKSIELVFFADLTQKAAAEKLQLPYDRFKTIYYDSLTELEHELFPYLEQRQAPKRQMKIKKEAVQRKKEALQAKQDAAARAEVLRKYLLGLPFADERNVL
jgi:RNA polymerase sigma factor (sigma-70 family)